ncbi:MAG: hypothetical protein HY017_10950 [Betaproteobacteria bacterium]|nr:hypothetical protein [Betaproteobacteria bacterium]
MLKWLVLAVVVIAALWLLRRSSPVRRDGSSAGGAGDDALVACAHCAVLLPRAEALERDGRLYCCDEHRRLGQAG